MMTEIFRKRLRIMKIESRFRDSNTTGKEDGANE
jgi:hypothetical protein